MRLKKSATLIGAVIASALALVAPASAAGSGSLSNTHINPNGSTAELTIGVTATGWPVNGGHSLYISECRVNDSGVFDFAADCSQASGKTIILDNSGNATGTYTVFSGDDPNFTDWGCGPLTSSDKTKYDTCYIRLQSGTEATTAGDIFLPITFDGTAVTTTTVVTNPDVPEAPLSILLPLGAAVLLGGVVLVARRRSPNTNV